MKQYLVKYRWQKVGAFAPLRSASVIVDAKDAAAARLLVVMKLKALDYVGLVDSVVELGST